jgi:hypothetical protein
MHVKSGMLKRLLSIEVARNVQSNVYFHRMKILSTLKHSQKQQPRITLRPIRTEKVRTKMHNSHPSLFERKMSVRIKFQLS